MTLGVSDGNRPTDPWVATQWEPGIRISPLEKLWLSVSYFRIDQENTPVAETVNSVTTYHFEGHTRSQGAELSLTGDVTENWTVFAMYAYTHYEDLEAAAGQPKSFARTPEHAFTANTSYRLHGCDVLEDVVVGAGYRFRSKSYATMRGSFVDDNLYFKPSHVFDVNVSVPFSKFGWSDQWFLTLGGLRGSDPGEYVAVNMSLVLMQARSVGIWTWACREASAGSALSP